MRNGSNLLCLLCLLLLNACSISSKISRDAQQQVLQQPVMAPAHVGISIMDAATGEYLYNYQGDKYFVPASNTKLFSLYAGMKYLGDSLVAIRYLERDSDILVLPGGDPTFLHPDYPAQPLLDFLKKQSKPISFSASAWQEEALGRGWSWDD